jgi:hypothetical protein
MASTRRRFNEHFHRMVDRMAQQDIERADAEAAKIKCHCRIPRTSHMVELYCTSGLYCGSHSCHDFMEAIGWW